MAIIINHHFIEKLLKQNKLINRTGCRLLFAIAMRIGKIILYIVCSMFELFQVTFICNLECSVGEDSEFKFM